MIFFLVLAGLAGILLMPQLVFAHGVQSGTIGCPVGACGTTDLHMVKAASDIIFEISLIMYVVILGMFSYALYKRKFQKEITNEKSSNLLVH